MKHESKSVIQDAAEVAKNSRYWHDAGHRQFCFSVWRLDIYVTWHERSAR